MSRRKMKKSPIRGLWRGRRRERGSRHGCKDDAHALSGSAPTSGVQGFSPGADKRAASALLWLFRCGDRQGRFWVGSMASRSFQIDNKRQRSLSDNFSAYVNYSLCLFESIVIKPVMRVYNSSNVTTVTLFKLFLKRSKAATSSTSIAEILPIITTHLGLNTSNRGELLLWRL